MLGEGTEHVAVPLHHLRHEFGDHHRGTIRQHRERRGSRVPHAEPADQHARPRRQGLNCAVGETEFHALRKMHTGQIQGDRDTDVQ